MHQETLKILSSLLTRAKSIVLDPNKEILLEYCGENRWKVSEGDRNTLLTDGSKFDYERLPSNRLDDHINMYRFSTAENAIETYLKWRDNQCFVAVKGSDHYWTYYGFDLCEASPEVAAKAYFERCKKENRKDLSYILIGKGFNIIDQHHNGEIKEFSTNFCNGLNEFNLSKIERIKNLSKIIVGMKEDYAIPLLTGYSGNDYRYRIVSRDGESFIGTCDLVPERLNLTIVNGTVCNVTLG